MLKVVRAASVAANVPFSLVVPGQEQWLVKAVCAVLSRAVGGVPNRAIQLAVSDGTNTVVVSPADDVGTEPGTLTVTWANIQPTAIASGATGVSVGPFISPSLPSGYVLTGTVLNAAVGDQWTRAVAWVDYHLNV